MDPANPSDPLSGTTTPCPVCGTPARIDQRFCGNCGTSLWRTCPVCNSENPIRFKFCNVCGSPLEAAPEEPSSPPTKRPALSTKDERRWVTVLLADISGFTALSERMDPEDVMSLAVHSADRISEEVRRFGGTVLRVVGDEVFAVFGAPVAHEDDTERALRAGLAIRDLNLSDDPENPVRVHVGINTGEVVFGQIGPQEIRDYTVMGDVVNTAARLRSAAPSGCVYVGEETFRETHRAIRYRQTPHVEAKGKDQPVVTWEAVEPLSEPRARSLGTVPLIGREDELDRLMGVWRGVVKQGQPHLVTILGEPGIGKSRLVAEFERSVDSQVTILHGRCLSYGEAYGYWALSQMLKEAAGITADIDPETALDHFVSMIDRVKINEEITEEVARHLSLLSGFDVQPEHQSASTDQRALHMSVVRFFEAYARETPLVLVFDDIHWADDALLDLIETIAARAREAPLLLVTQARLELLEKRGTWGRGVRSFTSMLLNPLSEVQERELFLALLHERGLPEQMVAKIERTAGGNPLFAEELVAMVAESGPAVRVPSVIKMLILARLDSLPVKERELMQVASVYGKTFWDGALRWLGLDGDLNILLDTLEEKDLLRPAPHSQFRGERGVVFKHDLIRDVAYEMLPRAERRRLHGMAADWLEKTAGDQIESFYDQLAHHAIDAGQSERGIQYLVRAAELASRTASHRKAAALITRAIEIANQIGLSTAATSDLYARRGKALTDVGLWDEAQPDLEAALAGLPPEEQDQRAMILLYLAQTHVWKLNIAGMRESANKALEIADQIHRDDLAAAAIIALSEAESSDGNLQGGLELYEQALHRAPGGRMVATPALTLQGLIYYWLGRSDEAIPHAHRAIQFAGENTSAMMYNLPHLGLAYAGAGRYDEAEKYFQEARRFGREYEIWPLLARAIAMSAGYHNEVFDYGQGEEISQEARELARSNNFLPTVISSGIDLIFNYTRRHEIGHAESLVDEVTEAVEKASGFHGWLWRIRHTEALAELALARGDREEAIRLADSAVEQSRDHGRIKYQAYALQTRASARMALGQTKEAIADLHQSLDLARSSGNPAVFLHAAVRLLPVDGNDDLLAQTQSTIKRIAEALPDETTRRSFLAAEPLRMFNGLAA